MNCKVLILSVAVSLLAACGSNQDDAAADTASSSVSFYSPLPDETIRFDFPFHLAKDHVYTVETGAVRRRLVLEHFNEDPGQVWASLTETMTAAGYSPHGEAQGEMARSFSKEGEEDLFLAVITGPVENQANPESVGSIRISWQLVPASEAAATAEPVTAGAADQATPATPATGGDDSPALAPATGNDAAVPSGDPQPADPGN